MGQKGIITSHDECDVYKQAMINWKQFKISMQHHTSVQDRNNSVCSQQIHLNRHYIKAITEVLQLCAMQDLPLRGHREGEDSHNPGNFLKILELIGIHDSVVRETSEWSTKCHIYKSRDTKLCFANNGRNA